MIETVPSTAGSTPYFNPSTQRFHDPMTKKMVKTPAAYKSTMNPDVLKPMQGPSMPDEQTGMVIGVLSSMRESLNELVTLTKQSLGLEQKEDKRDIKQLTDEKLEKGDTDPGPSSGGSDSGGFLEGLKNMFAGMKEKFVIGDKLKLLLLAGGLFALSKYSETIIEKLAPILFYMKNKLIPRIKKIGEWFLKPSDDGIGTELDWTKILGVGLGVLVVKNLGGLLFSIAALKLGKAALALLGVGAGKGVPFRLLPIAAALAAFSTVGDFVAGTNWGDEVTGGKPVEEWKKGLAAAFAGANNKEGSYGAAIKQGLKWGAMGAYAGSFFGPFGTLIGGTLGLLAGGIAGAMGSDRLLKILDGEAEKMAETALTNALNDNVKNEVQMKNAKKLLDQEDKTFNKILSETGDLSLAEASRMSEEEFIKQTGQSKTKTRGDKERNLNVEAVTGGDITGTVEELDSVYNPEIYKTLLGFQNMGGKLNEAEKEYILMQERIKEIRLTAGQIETEKENFRAINKRLKKAGKAEQYSFEFIEGYRLDELSLGRGYIDDSIFQMQDLAEDNFGRFKGPAYDRSVYGDPDILKIEKNVNKELNDLKDKTRRDMFENMTGYKKVEDVPGVQVFKGTDNYLNSTTNNMAFFKKTVHDDITMNQLATSR